MRSADAPDVGTKLSRFLANRDLFDELPNPVCVVNAAGIVGYANPAFERFAEPRAGERSFEAVVAVPSRGRRLRFSYAPDAARLVARDVPPEEWTDRVDHLVHPIDWTGEAGEPAGTAYHFYQQSSTSGAEIQESLRELDTIHKVKRDFLTRVTHELNTPLTSLMGFAEILKNPEDLDPDTIQEFCREIWQSGSRIQAIVSDIVNLARLDAGLLQYSYESADLNQLVRSTASIFEEQYEMSQVTLSLDLAEGIGRVRLDPDRVRDVLSRFLTNALTHSQSGQRVRVQTENRGAEVLCAVRDEGRGLDSDEMAQVFRDFNLLHDIQHHQVGLGLGLSLSKRMIEEGHGGRVWVESAGRGKGAAFHFSLPR